MIRRIFRFMSIGCLLIFVHQTFALIAPVRKNPDGNYTFISTEDIKMVIEKIDLYHHPLGIWLVTYEAKLQNLRAFPKSLTMSFPAGFDMRLVERSLVCDYFENFRVFINDKKVDRVKYLEKCFNYVSATGTEWTMDDGSGIGFLNTWNINFKPEETKNIKIIFNFMTTKPSIIYNAYNDASWYKETMNWIRQDYADRGESQFKLPLNLGSFWAYYPDSIVVRAYFSHEWLKIVDAAKRKYKSEHITIYEYCEPYGFYSPPEVELESPGIEELQKFTVTELLLLKNSFVAKYGRIFNSQILKLFFSHQPWYTPNPDFHAWFLTDWDVENIRSIHNYEQSLK